MVNLQSGNEYLFQIRDCKIPPKINSVHTAFQMVLYSGDQLVTCKLCLEPLALVATHRPSCRALGPSLSSLPESSYSI